MNKRLFFAVSMIFALLIASGCGKSAETKYSEALEKIVEMEKNYCSKLESAGDVDAVIDAIDEQIEIIKPLKELYDTYWENFDICFKNTEGRFMMGNATKIAELGTCMIRTMNVLTKYNDEDVNDALADLNEMRLKVCPRSSLFGGADMNELNKKMREKMLELRNNQ